MIGIHYPTICTYHRKIQIVGFKIRSLNVNSDHSYCFYSKIVLLPHGPVADGFSVEDRLAGGYV